LDPASTLTFEYTPQHERLTVGNHNCELKPRSLLLGISDKRDNKKLIGQFGEGYKLALLVLTRLSYDVTIYNNEFIWKPRFEYNEEYESNVLVITIEEAEVSSPGVFFEIKDVGQRAYAGVCEKFLGANSPTNVILKDDFLRSKVFVNGLFVCQIEKLSWGYNFSADRIKVDRDRGMASTFDVTWQASKLWEQTSDPKQLYKEFAKDSLDVEFCVRPTSATSNAIVEQFKAEHPGCVPVATQEELSRNKSKMTVLVPQVFKNLLVRMETFVFEKGDTPGEWLERFDHAYSEWLPPSGKTELAEILDASKGWCGVCPPRGES